MAYTGTKLARMLKADPKKSAEIIADMLEAHDFSILPTATAIGIAPMTLSRWIKKHTEIAKAIEVRKKKMYAELARELKEIANQ